MKVKDYAIGDEKHILDLFEIVFKRKMSEKYWIWRFRKNPAGKHMIKLMWDGDILAGHYAVSPVKLIVDGQEMLTALSMTTMTHPEYGRRGIFGTLASELYSWIANDLGVKAVWGFPNNNSHYGFIKKLAWKNIGIAHEISIKPNRLDPYSPNNCKISHDFTDEHIRLLEKDLASKKTYVKKNAEYLSWRYIDNPSQNYTIFDYRTSGILNGFLVAKQYKLNSTEAIVNILEVGGCDNFNMFGSMLSFACNHFESTIKFCTMWMSLFDEKYLQLEKMGFTPSGNNTYVGYRPFSEGLDTMGYLNNWYYTFGDSDVY